MLTKVVTGFLIFTAASLFIQCSGDETEFIGPDFQLDTILKVTEFESSREQVRINGDTCTVSVVILNASNETVEGITGVFESLNGSFEYDGGEAYAESDSSGTLTATFISGAVIQLEQIILTVASIKDTIPLNVVSDIASLVVSASGEFLHADGESTLEITATAMDADGEPVANTGIFFTTDRGTFDNGELEYQTQSDLDGRVTAVFTSEGSSQDVLAHIRLTVQDVEGIAEDVFIDLIGLTLDIETAPGILPADGQTITALTARLKETVTGNPLSGEMINWTTTAGVIQSPVITDELGAAVTQIVSSSAPGEGVIRASYKSLQPTELTIQFEGN